MLENVITKDEKVYGIKYFISALLENDITIFDEIVSKLKKRNLFLDHFFIILSRYCFFYFFVSRNFHSV